MKTSKEHPPTPKKCETHDLYYDGDECWKCRGEEPRQRPNQPEVLGAIARGEPLPERRDETLNPTCDMCGWPPPAGWVRQKKKCVACNRPVYEPPLLQEYKPPADPIHHPPHYANGRKHEPAAVIRDWNLNFALGNAVKYISRVGRKGDALEDLKKARWYINDEIAALEADDEK